MKKVVLLGSLAALAIASLPVSAQMSNLTDVQMRDVTGQSIPGYTVTVAGSVTDTYTVPFAYQIFSSKAPVTASNISDLVAIWAPNYPSNVAATRSGFLTDVNGGLAAASGILQSKPLIGPFVPNVSIAAP